MIRKHAILSPDAVVINVIMLEEGETGFEPPEGCSLMAVGDKVNVEVGSVYDTKSNSFKAPEPPEVPPVINIEIEDVQTEEGGAFDAGSKEVTCVENTLVTISGKVTMGGALLSSLTSKYRVPFISSDGRELVCMAGIVEGIISCSFKLPSGVWVINNSTLNKRITNGPKFNIPSPITVFSCQDYSPK